MSGFMSDNYKVQCAEMVKKIHRTYAIKVYNRRLFHHTRQNSAESNIEEAKATNGGKAFSVTSDVNPDVNPSLLLHVVPSRMPHFLRQTTYSGQCLGFLKIW
jgi:hypothetical protein